MSPRPRAQGGSDAPKHAFGLWIDPTLRPLMPPAMRAPESLWLDAGTAGAIKDVIESLRIPHTEVAQITADGKAVGFGHRPRPGQRLAVTGTCPPLDPSRPTILRPEPLDRLRFLVDVNAARLTGLLRILGFDTTCPRRLSDRELAERAAREGRFLLTRDRGLLMRRIVAHGRLLRASAPWPQLAEVVRLLDLGGRMSLWRRCPRCNGTLETVAKAEVRHRLPPLTAMFHNRFHRCPDCRQIYWPGSHTERFLHRLGTVLPELSIRRP